MMTFEEYLKKSKKDVDEDEIAAAAPASASDGVVAAPHGTTDADVLGKCDHDGHGGFFKKGCFHIPKPVFKKPLSRLAGEIPGGKRKKKHHWPKVQLVADGEKDCRMSICIPEAELPASSRAAIAKMTEDDLQQFIADNYDISWYDVYEVVDVAWAPDAQALFIKFYELSKSSYKPMYIEARADSNGLSPEDRGSKPLSGAAMLKRFKAKHPGASARFTLCWK